MDVSELQSPCALYRPSRNQKEMAKAILLHRQNLCMRKQDMCRTHRYESRQSCVHRSYRFCMKQNLRQEEQWEEGGHIIIAWTPVSPAWNAGGRGRGPSLCLMKCLMLLFNQEKRHFQGIKRSCFNNQLCNRTSEEAKILSPRVDNSPLTQRLWSQNDFCQWNVGTLWRWVQIDQTYFSLHVRTADLTSSFLYLTYTPFLCTLPDFSKNIDWKFNIRESGT